MITLTILIKILYKTMNIASRKLIQDAFLCHRI